MAYTSRAEKKYGAAPLDISLSPGVDKLDLQEKEVLRLGFASFYPHIYTRVRTCMNHESGNSKRKKRL